MIPEQIRVIAWVRFLAEQFYLRRSTYYMFVAKMQAKRTKFGEFFIVYTAAMVLRGGQAGLGLVV
jgi:hypothetical protein